VPPIYESIIFPVLLHGCDTWYIENRVMRGICGEVGEDCMMRSHVACMEGGWKSVAENENIWQEERESNLTIEEITYLSFLVSTPKYN
jgi:hypothetical protein